MYYTEKVSGEGLFSSGTEDVNCREVNLLSRGDRLQMLIMQIEQTDCTRDDSAETEAG